MSLLLLALAQQRGGLPSHSKLDDAMFWVGALFAFTPIVAALSVLGVVWWNRKKQARQSRGDTD